MYCLADAGKPTRVKESLKQSVHSGTHAKVSTACGPAVLLVIDGGFAAAVGAAVVGVGVSMHNDCHASLLWLTM